MIIQHLLHPILAVLCVLSCVSSKPYDGYKLYEVPISTGHEVQLLLYLQHHRPSIDIWALNKLGPKRMLVPANLQKTVEHFFKDQHINYTVKVEDFGKKYSVRQAPLMQLEDPTFLNSYPTYDEINDYLVQLATENFEWIRFRIIGWSVEGRPIRAITINPDKQRTIIVDAGIHAREWITVSTALYLIKKLIEDSDQYRILHEYKWVIVPLVNPDGYIYSMETDRYWRKNRRRLSDKCVGVDLNRNFGFRWDVGASLFSGECHPGFRGYAPFSEPESRALRTVFDNNPEAELYINLHSFGGYLIYPWSYESTPVANVGDFKQVGVAAARAMWHYSHQEYKVGSSAEILRYQASGTSIDYAYSVGIDYPFAMEIAEFGYSDFQPPTNAIADIVKESFVGIKELVYAVRKLKTQQKG
ncbi:carboxypeptidase B1 [Aedes albopictus]|uniref:Peptidase M14 domain-containing protein n=1 Tax=Aedes albopictus TaxID=7160 RepID=A0ABM2A7Q7_AEDAL|nr:carboxypeptidase B isoform X1 [Aedes albopictus]